MSNKQITSFDELVNFTNITSLAGSFFGCDNLTAITLPSRVNSITNGALRGTKLKNLILPASLTNIGTYTLYPNAMDTWTVLATTPPTIANSNIPPQYIYVPVQSIEAYKSASVWSTWASRIEAIPQ